MKSKIVKFIGALLVCQLAGAIGSIATFPNINSWYADIVKPSFNPPNWIFAPVWTTLFLLMGISLYLIWISKNKQKKQALNFFYIQLVLNIVWSYLFFALKSPAFAFMEIIVLWFFILLTIINFYRISKPASILLWPYLAWVSFASILNYAIWSLN